MRDANDLFYYLIFSRLFVRRVCLVLRFYSVTLSTRYDHYARINRIFKLCCVLFSVHLEEIQCREEQTGTEM